MKTGRHFRASACRPRGSVSLLYLILLPPIIGFIGLAIDLSFAYTRRTEMQTVADTAAMAAARELNGTVPGITDALTEARTIAQRQTYSFVRPIVWDDSAVRFSDSPDKPEGDWLPAGAISAATARNMYYVKVDTTALGDQGSVDVIFSRVLGITMDKMTMVARAIAGRTSVQVTPLAVCAINNTEMSTRAVVKPTVTEQELLQFGFRRGVSYNLLNMNPHGASPVSYVVNPLDFPNQPETATNRSVAIVKPFVCAGSIATSNLRRDARVYVGNPFPAELAPELNSRFGDTNSSCNRIPAPPDRNIKEFSKYYIGWWMNSAADINGAAEPYMVGSGKLTIADQSSSIVGINKTSYGPLWSYSKAVKYNAAAAGGVGAVFSRDDWRYLYPVGPATAELTTAYADASPSPYSTGGVHREAPTGVFFPLRRVLNIPLLECPVAGSSARVLAIGRFLMSSRASATAPAVYGEFGGLATDAELSATVGLFR